MQRQNKFARGIRVENGQKLVRRSGRLRHHHQRLQLYDHHSAQKKVKNNFAPPRSQRRKIQILSRRKRARRAPFRENHYGKKCGKHHRTRKRFQRIRRRQCHRQYEPLRTQRRIRHFFRAFGLRQNHHAAHDRGVRDADGGKNTPQRQGYQQSPPQPPPRQYGLSKIRPVSPSQRI